MAVEETKKDTKLKVTVNHGEKLGKIERSSKSYGDVDHEATKEQMRSAYKHITGMQEPIREKQVKVTAEEMIEVA